MKRKRTILNDDVVAIVPKKRVKSSNEPKSIGYKEFKNKNLEQINKLFPPPNANFFANYSELSLNDNESGINEKNNENNTVSSGRILELSKKFDDNIYLISDELNLDFDKTREEYLNAKGIRLEVDNNLHKLKEKANKFYSRPEKEAMREVQLNNRNCELNEEMKELDNILLAKKIEIEKQKEDLRKVGLIPFDVDMEHPLAAKEGINVIARSAIVHPWLELMERNLTQHDLDKFKLKNFVSNLGTTFYSPRIQELFNKINKAIDELEVNKRHR